MGKFMKLIILARLAKGEIVAGTLKFKCVQDACLRYTALAASVNFKCERKVIRSRQIINPSAFLTPSEYRNQIDPTLPGNIVRACDRAIKLKHFWIFQGSNQLV